MWRARKLLIGLGCLGALGLLVLHPVLAAGFVLIDDHEILAFSPGAIEDLQLGHPTSLLYRIFVDDANSGRMRPMYQVIRFAQIGVMDGNPLGWHAFYVVLGLLSAGLMFAMLRLAGCDGLSAFLAAAWLLVAPGVSSVWIRLGPQEGLGTALVLLASWAAARDAPPRSLAPWVWLSVLALTAAAFVKESFTLIVPAIVGFALLMRYRRDGRCGITGGGAIVPALVSLTVGLVALVISFVTVSRSGSSSYGGRIFSSAGLVVNDQTLTNLAIMAQLGAVVVPLLVLSVVIEFWRRRRPTPAITSWCLGALLVALFVLPQLMLYRGGSGFVVGRYLLPAGIGLAAGVAAGLTWLRNQRHHALLVATAAVWVMHLAVFSVWTWHDAELFRADAEQLARLVDRILAASSSGSIVGLAAHPIEDYERVVSFRYQLAAKGGNYLDQRLLLVPSSGSEAEREWGAALAQRYFPNRANPLERGCGDIAVVVLLAPEQVTRDALPCLSATEFHRESFEETVVLPAVFPAFLGQLFPPASVVYSLLLRTDEPQNPLATPGCCSADRGT